MPWILLHQTWQMNLPCPMDPQDTAETPWMSVHNLCLIDPSLVEQRCLEYWYTTWQTHQLWLIDPPNAKWQFHTDYWYLLVKNSNFTLILTFIGQERQFSHCYWYLDGQNWLFHIATWHLVGQQWPFNIATDIKWYTMAISHWHWQPLVK